MTAGNWMTVCIRRALLTATAASLLASAGCGNKKDTVRQRPGNADSRSTATTREPVRTEPTKTASTEPEKTASSETVAAKPADKPAQASTPPEPARPVQAAKTNDPPKGEWPPATDLATDSDSSETEMSEEERKRIIEDGIYVRIRITMEKMLDQRKQLLAAGTNPSDEQIQNLERSILRARSLLTGNGEKVDDVQPPLTARPEQPGPVTPG